ncbi:MAG: hypothetical protein V1778_00635 [bacterium]
MKRTILTIALALLLIATGGALWVAYVTLQSPHHGDILGEETGWPAFWRSGELFFVGGEHPTLKVLDLSGIAADAPIGGVPDARQVAVSRDHSLMILVSHDGSQDVFWRFAEEQAPVPIAATRGEVKEIAFSASAKTLFFLAAWEGETRQHLLLLNTESGSLMNVSTDAASATWIDSPSALLSVDSRGKIWYHALRLSGETESPSFIGDASSVLIPEQGKAAFLFVGKTDKEYALRSYNLATKEQRLLAPLPSIPEGRSFLLRASPSGKNLLVLIPTVTEKENCSLALVSTETGAVSMLAAQARDVRWRDDGQFLYERMSAGLPQVWTYALDTQATALLFPDPLSAFGR